MRAAAVGTPLLRQLFLSGDWARNVNGWLYPPPEYGRMGDDFLWRASLQSLVAMNLIPNQLDRYSAGDHTGLVRDGYGGLTIYLQPDPPGDNRVANWLPTSGEHTWFVVLRLYRPHRQVVDATWRCPGLERVD